MNKTGYFVKSVSAWVAVVIVITAFTKEPLKIWLLGSSLALWLLYITIKAVQSKKRKSRKNERITSIVGEPMDWDFDASSAAQLLLCHINNRITTHLRSAFPDAYWEWAADNPECLAVNGGIGRIKLHGVEGYTHAEITIDNISAKITCDLLKLERVEAQLSGANMKDAGTWFRRYGEAALSHIAGDLSSRGYNDLTVTRNGDVLIDMPEGYAKINCLRNFPEAQHWDDLCGLIENAGYNISDSNDGICLSWDAERVAA